MPKLKIFSTENFLRILNEQQESRKADSSIALSKIVNVLGDQEESKDFFYKYRKMSISSGNLFKVMKTEDQIREEKAVLLFYRKR
jgi:hypothetical protein